MGSSKRPPSQDPPPERFPVIVPLRTKKKTFPSRFLSNEHCIARHGRGLKNMAERGGMGVEEIAANIMRTTGEGALPSRDTALFIMRETLRANGYSEEEIEQWR